VLKKCAEDILYWVNGFVYMCDPRLPLSERTVIPFLTFPFQDDAFAALIESMGRNDVHIEKSRDEGASWMCVCVLRHPWQFGPTHRFMMMSRKGDLVDKRDDPDSLFGKADFINEMMPPLLMPRGWISDGSQRSWRKSNMLINRVTKSVIRGESTRGEPGAGGRNTAVLLDEFGRVDSECPGQGMRILASLVSNTNCRIYNSTPQGPFGAFYKQSLRKPSKGRFVKIRMHWSQDPRKNVDLWYDDEGKSRSPWYDDMCEQIGDPAVIARELDINYVGAGHRFFDQTLVDRLERECVQPPFTVGHLMYDKERLYPDDFESDPAGRLALWINLEAYGCPPRDREYAIGVDVSAGSGSSNSTAVVLDKGTGEQVAEYADPFISPRQLAHLIVALARWFRGRSSSTGAYLIWEANGFGIGFGQEIVDAGYLNVFFSKDEIKLGARPTDRPGWWSTRPTRLSAMSEFRGAMTDGMCVLKSAELVDEMNYYETGADGWVQHVDCKDRSDPSGARDNHGDRVVGAMLAWKGCKERPGTKAFDLAGNPPRGSLAERMKVAREQDRYSGARWYDLP
jgi:hypothetical protein